MRSAPLLLWRLFQAAFVCTLLIAPQLEARDRGARPTVKRLKIDTVPAGFRVGFCLLTHGHKQYVAYYDAQHQMIVASRTVDTSKWNYTKLPTKIGWDSHNYITMAMDDDGHLHLSGNMHVVPLIYFRTTKSGDASTLTRIDRMTGHEEKRCTYPNFMRGPSNELIFHYRSGSSGRGNEIYNVYDLKSKTWTRLLDKPLTNGRGKMNAYLSGPKLGPDGRYHMIWVWRDTSDCSTNHHLSYARSPNLRDWETAGGHNVPLPLTIDEKRLYVDPIPPKGGILNGGAKLGFTSTNAPVVSYYKYDKNGKHQMYVAAFSGGKWRSKQLTDWDYRWDFSGGGSLPSVEVSVGAPHRIGAGKMRVSYRHKKYGSGYKEFKEADLRPDPVKSIPIRTRAEPKSKGPGVPGDLREVTSKFPGMRTMISGDIGAPSVPNTTYVIRWESLSANRDRKPPKIPPDSTLELIEIR